MKDYEENGLRFFAEWVPYEEGNEKSKEAARQYLKTWKKLLLIKLKSELYDYEPYDGQVSDGDKMKENPDGWYEHWVDRSAMYSGALCTHASLALKFCMKKKLPYQII